MSGQVSFKLKDTRLWYYRAMIHTVINGDTVLALLDKGFNDFTFMRLRLYGVDAPDPEPRVGTLEARSLERALGIKARARLAELVAGREVILRVYRTSKIDRFLAEIFLPEDPTKTANEVLLNEKLARPFIRPSSS